MPFFILAGSLIEKGRVAEYLVRFADVIVGRIKGGMAATGIITMAIFGAISGASAAAICSIGPVMIPELIKEGYPRGYAASFITLAAASDLLIPPSVSMVIYGWLTDTPIAACFLAGTGPGILFLSFLIVYNLIMLKKMPSVRKPRAWGSTKEVVKELAFSGRQAFPGLLMPVLVLGSIYGGIATATEAAAVAAAYAIIIGFLVYRGLTVKVFIDSLVETGATIGVIMILLFCAVMLARMFTMEKFPQTVAAFMLDLSSNKYMLLLIINLFLIFLGMIMDDASAIIISVPLLFPLIKGIGISPVHFASIVTTNLAMGCLTPPVAPLLYTGQRVSNVPFSEMIGPSMRMIIFVFLPVVFITTYWPALSTWLPKVILGSKVFG
jgi:tripartite ATP-independent transporter DctM subunit